LRRQENEKTSLSGVDPERSCFLLPKYGLVIVDHLAFFFLEKNTSGRKKNTL